MKKLIVLCLITFAFLPVAANAQTSSECSSIEQKSGQAPTIEGSSPANIGMELIDSESFSINVNANPSYTLSFIQVVYTDSVGTHILNPGPQALPPTDITTHWQAQIDGKFNFYKVSGCQAFQASTTTSTTQNTPPQTPLELVCPVGEREVINADGSQECQAEIQIVTPPYTPNTPVPVLVNPSFTG